MTEDENIYVPTEEDRDPEAEEQMDAVAEGSLRDPWFESDEEALNWEGHDGVQE